MYILLPTASAQVFTSQYIKMTLLRALVKGAARRKETTFTHAHARAHTGGQTSGRHILPGVAGTASIVSSSVLAAANGILSSWADRWIGALRIPKPAIAKNLGYAVGAVKSPMLR